MLVYVVWHSTVRWLMSEHSTNTKLNTYLTLPALVPYFYLGCALYFYLDALFTRSVALPEDEA